MRFTGSYFVTVISSELEFPVLDFGYLTITRYISDLNHKIPSVTL